MKSLREKHKAQWLVPHLDLGKYIYDSLLYAWRLTVPCRYLSAAVTAFLIKDQITSREGWLNIFRCQISAGALMMTLLAVYIFMRPGSISKYNWNLSFPLRVPCFYASNKRVLCVFYAFPRFFFCSSFLPLPLTNVMSDPVRLAELLYRFRSISFEHTWADAATMFAILITVSAHRHINSLHPWLTTIHLTGTHYRAILRSEQRYRL